MTMSSHDALALGSDTRPPVLFRGNYYQWKSRFLNFIDNQDRRDEILESLEKGPAPIFTQPGTDTPLEPSQMSTEQKQRIKGDRQSRSYLLQAIPDGIFEDVDSYDTGKEIWDELKKQMQGSNTASKTRTTTSLTNYEGFKQTEGELLNATYKRFCNLLNELRKNKVVKTKLEINIKFLYNLEPCWERHAMNIIQNKDIEELEIHSIVEVLELNQPEVSRTQAEIKKITPPSLDPLALVAVKKPTRSSSYSKKSMPVESDSDSLSDSEINESQRQVMKAISLFSKAVQRKYTQGTPTNNNLRTSTSSSYASKKPDYKEKYDKPQFPVGKREAAEKSEEKNCYNCGKFGHFARECRKPKVKDSNYYKHKMLLAKQEESGTALLAEDDSWLYFTDDESEDLKANVCFMTKLSKSNELNNKSSSTSDAENNEVDTELDFVAQFHTMRKYINSLIRERNSFESEIELLKTDLTDKTTCLSKFELENEVLSNKLTSLDNEIQTVKLENESLKDSCVSSSGCEISENAMIIELEKDISDLNKTIKRLQIERTGETLRVNSLTEEVELYKEKLKEFQPNLNILNDKVCDLNHAVFMKECECTNLLKEIDVLKKQLISYEQKLYKQNQSEQTIFMNRPKNFEKILNGEVLSTYDKEGVGFDNPHTLLSAQSQVRPLYDLDYMRFGLTMKFVRTSSEGLEDEDSKRSLESRKEFELFYDPLNESYAKRKPNFTKDHEHIENETSEEHVASIDQTKIVSKLYIPSHILEQQIVDLKQEITTKETIYVYNESQFMKIIEALRFYISSLEENCVSLSPSVNLVTETRSKSPDHMPKPETTSIGITVSIPEDNPSKSSNNDFEKRVNDLQKELAVKTSIFQCQRTRFFNQIEILEKERHELNAKVLQLQTPEIISKQKVVSPESKTRFAKTSMYSKTSLSKKAKTLPDPQIPKKENKGSPKSTQTSSPLSNETFTILKNPLFLKKENEGTSKSVPPMKSNTPKTSTQSPLKSSTQDKSQPMKSKSPAHNSYSCYKTKNRPFLVTENRPNGEPPRFHDQYGSFSHKPRKTTSMHDTPKVRKTKENTNTTVFPVTGLKSTESRKQVWIPKDCIVKANKSLSNATKRQFPNYVMSSRFAFVRKDNVFCNISCTGKQSKPYHAMKSVFPFDMNDPKYMYVHLNVESAQKVPPSKWVPKCC